MSAERWFKGLKVGVLMGGLSEEREVSLKTGSAIVAALSEAGVDVVGMDVKRDLVEVLQREPIDIAFVALHGTVGEDGVVQGVLEYLGIPYTGSRVLGSAACMNKVVSRWVCESQGIPVPRGTVVDASMSPVYGGPSLDELGMPLVVKPPEQGSTVGVSIVREQDRLAEAIELALRYGDTALVETYVPGKELTVGVLGSQAFPVIEIRPKSGFYDYRSKYTPGMTEYLVPAPLDEVTTSQVQELAVKAHLALQCRGATRVDFRLSDQDGIPYFLEVNTIPGMTETSLLPKAAAVAGYSFSELVLAILKEAWQRASSG